MSGLDEHSVRCFPVARVVFSGGTGRQEEPARGRPPAAYSHETAKPSLLGGRQCRLRIVDSPLEVRRPGILHTAEVLLLVTYTNMQAGDSNSSEDLLNAIE